MLIKVDTHEYPVSEAEFVSRFPDVSFPQVKNYEDFGYAVVFPTPQPATDWYHLAREIAPELTDKGHWEQQWEVVEVTRPLEVARAEVKRRVTAHRWAVETGGISVANYGRVLTSIEDQNRIATAIQGCTSANIQEVDFKGADGWVSITREKLIQISVLIAEHVQLCFTRERELHEAADACTDVPALAAIDIEAGWPGQGD